MILVVGGGSVSTFDQDSLAQPKFTGLLTRAPYVVGQTQGLVQRLESYRSGLADFVDSVTSLYALGSRLPGTADGVAKGEVTTVLHISDIHDNPLGFDLTARLVKQFGADLVVDTGDITTNGTALEGDAAQPDRRAQGALRVRPGQPRLELDPGDPLRHNRMRSSSTTTCRPSAA